ncbi:MAG: hypothetical protein JNL74_14910, partial [Fibrobacteres bacterium]|nr:hypothetical protein [Fibrobacterota bacterium]
MSGFVQNVVRSKYFLLIVIIFSLFESVFSITPAVQGALGGQDAVASSGPAVQAKSVSSSNTTSATLSNVAPSSKSSSGASSLQGGNIQPGGGFVSFSHDLFTLTSGSGLKMDIGLDYSNGSVYDQVRKNNLDAPTGVAGLGWSFTNARIFVNHNGTVAINDDKWFYQDDMGAVFPIEYGRGTSATKLFIKGLLTYKVTYKLNTDNVISGWELIKPDGTRMLFGDYDLTGSLNALGVNYFCGTSIGIFPIPYITTVFQRYYADNHKYFFDSWYISKVVQPNKKNNFVYTYTNREVSDYITGEPIGVSGSAVYSASTGGTQLVVTKAVYLKTIQSSTGDRVEFIYSDKDPSEYEDPTPGTEPDINVDPIEKKFLSSVELYNGSNSLYSAKYSFQYNVNGFLNITGGTETRFNKRLLNKIITRKQNAFIAAPTIDFT